MTSKGDAASTSGEESAASCATFQAIDRTDSPPAINLPDELWMTILESPSTFPPDVFAGVMLNLIKNPNITSSHLFRADIFYDSDKDHALEGSSGSLVNHLKAEYKPLPYEIPGCTRTRTIVRQMVPRNPQLDKPLVQTCHFFTKDTASGEEESIVIYLPHGTSPSDLPFYHPEVARLAFLHTWPSTPTPTAKISLSYSLFPTTPFPLPPKLTRTALRLLQTLHKHGQGQLRGYQKRVHLDQIIPQKRYQDTYARLKATYGRLLSEKWVEVTDPGKHVFEDIAIAAFLVELWADMYSCAGAADGAADGQQETKPSFPGFVDIGCGNGVLAYILLSEGYEGWGFDARERKTWAIFPPEIQGKLQRRLLVPGIFQSEASAPPSNEGREESIWHDGIFTPGTFILSNHADELTPWTPLLAHLNHSPFLAIPCCSHDLAGSRFRAPATTKASKKAESARCLPHQQQDGSAAPPPPPSTASKPSSSSQPAETGSLAQTPAQKKMPSAYATLCGYVSALAAEVGYLAEEDVLRIPSTRNRCLVGRRSRTEGARHRNAEGETGREGERMAEVREIVERELGRSVEVVGREWIQGAEGLARKPGSGH